jgi:hypothetical protein
LRFPLGAPLPGAPPCIRQRRFFFTGWEKDKDEEFILFEPEEVTAIYLGCRMSQTDAKAIKNLAAKEYAHAALYTGSKSKTRFAVEFAKA